MSDRTVDIPLAAPLHAYLRQHARSQPDKPAFLWYGAALSYAALDAASDAFAAGEFVGLVVAPVAREPDAQAHHQRGDDQHEQACGKGMGLVFHQRSLAMAGGAMARKPRSP